MKLLNTIPKFLCLATSVVYSAPVFLSLLINGRAVLPPGWFMVDYVGIPASLLALTIMLVFTILFFITPGISVRPPFVFSISSSTYRLLLIFIYLSIALFCIYYIDAKTNFLSKVITDPVFAILSLGGTIVQEKLLLYSFLVLSVFIAYSLVAKDDALIIRMTVYVSCALVVLFLFFTGRRENVLLALFFLFFSRSGGGKSLFKYGALLSVAALIVSVVLYLRLSVNDGDSIGFGLDAEELSPVAISAYIVENYSVDFLGSIDGSTLFRLFLSQDFKSISGWFMIAIQGNSADRATPVIGLVGASHLYGYVIPLIQVIIFACLCNSVSRSFIMTRSPAIKVFEIFLAFKLFNLFRNGEFPIVTLDVLMFTFLVYPAILVRFKSTQNNNPV